MAYREIEEELLSEKYNVSIPGLERIKEVLKRLDGLQDKLNVVHVVGTNGKGSVSAMLALIYQSMGKKTGVFSSPYISSLTEYIRIYDECREEFISEENFAEISAEIMNLLDDTGLKLTHFEFVTVLAVLYFYRQNCDICIFEAGMGGQKDATNIFSESICTGITSISLEHEKFLGSTLTEIAETKAGICNHKGRIFAVDYACDSNDEISKTLKRVSDEKEIILSGIKEITKREIREGRLHFNYGEIGQVIVPTNAMYQAENAALAIEMSGCRDISLINSALSSFYIKSRFEFISKKPLFIVDGAHNPAGARALAESLEKYDDNGKYVFITGVMKDKDYAEIYDKLDRYAEAYICVDNLNKRALPSYKLSAFLKRYKKPVYDAGNTLTAAAIMKQLSTEKKSFLYAGSLYFSDGIKKSFLKLFDENENYNPADEYVERLTSTDFYSKNYSLDDMRFVLEKIGNPQKNLRFIHIAGTNGKGSTSRMIYELISQNGLKTGLFTSPYIKKFNERISLNGLDIPDDMLAGCAERIYDICAENNIELNQFALLTCIAFVYYNLVNADYVVLETGLGGTYDPTNVIEKPVCCTITNIGLDHTAVLGDTIEHIAEAKAGIIKKNCPTALYPVEKKVADIFAIKADEMHSELHKVSEEEIDEIDDAECDEDLNRFKYKGLEYVIRLMGKFQIRNACVALETYKIIASNDNRLNISHNYIKSALAEVLWKGRLEKVSNDPLIYIDGGHNPQCILSITEYFNERHKDKRKIYIAGFMKNKDYKTMISILLQNSDELLLTPVSIERSLSKSELTNIVNHDTINTCVCEDLYDAYKRAVKKADKNSVICIIGSLYQLNDIYSIIEKVKD